MTIKNKRKKQEKSKYGRVLKLNLSEEYFQFKREMEMKLWFGGYSLEKEDITIEGLLTQIHNDRIR